MALTYRDKKKWRLVGLMTILGGTIGFAYSGLRMLAGVMPVLFSELEISTRTGLVIGLGLAWFMTFIVYDTPGTVFRRMGFIKGWLTLAFICIAYIMFCLITQLVITSMIWSMYADLGAYFRVELYFDILIAGLFFLLFTFIMQMRRLIGEGIMWQLVTGRYHEPRIERRIYMFLDIKGSTAIAEQLGDKLAHSFLSDVFFVADRLISEFRGEVLSFNGDELVASWIENRGLDNARCLNCYRAIIAALGKQSDHFQESYRVSPSLWVGIHVGDVVVGECGDSKLSIVHVGDTPNTAARLEQHAKDSDEKCVISAALMDKLVIPVGFEARRLESVTLRGHSHETQLYAVDIQ